MRLGGAWSRKRTALYEVTAESLSYLSDLPSAGDTSYAGVVLRDGFAYIDYYTSAVERDYPWLLGMFHGSELMADDPRYQARAATLGQPDPRTLGCAG